MVRFPPPACFSLTEWHSLRPLMDSPLPHPALTPESESALLAIRREKLAKLTEAGVNAYGGRFDTTHTLAELRERFAEGLTVRAAGRITARRDMGKTQFFDVSDLEGRFQ